MTLQYKKLKDNFKSQDLTDCKECNIKQFPYSIL